MQLRQRLEYKKGDETNISFWSHSFWLGLHVLVRIEQGREEKEEEEGEEREEIQVWNYVYLDFYGFWV